MVDQKMGLNVGSGFEARAGWVNVDLRGLAGVVDVKADIRRLPFADQQFQWILAESVLEHLDDPRPAIFELRRLLRSDGKVEVRIPALGTNAAHLDPTHKYLADLKHWVDLMREQFQYVDAGSIGVRWRYHTLLVAIQYFLIKGLGFHELGQCWVLIAKLPREMPMKLIPERWWLD